MKRGGPLKTDAAKLRAWQERGARKYANRVRPQPVHKVVEPQSPGPMQRAVPPVSRSPRRRRDDGPWRAAVIALRGEFCRSCLTTVWLQADHVFPKSQGGKSDVENGTMLCASCHDDKTNSRIVIEFGWLDPDQVDYLAAVGWVTWDDDGQPTGRGWKHFGPRPRPEIIGRVELP